MTEKFTIINEDSKIKSRIQAAITFSLMSIIVLIINFIIRNHVPAENKQLVDMMTGALLTMLSTSVNYFFGTTASSNAKDAMIYKSTPLKEEEKKEDSSKVI